MTTTSRTYEGRWRKLINSASAAVGSIHDDETARSLGFAGGFVPGSTVGQATVPAIIDRYGRSWMEGGWYTFTLVSPTYIHEDVREVAEPGDDGSIIVRIVNREGRVCSAGTAGLGYRYPWLAAGMSGEGGPAGADAENWTADFEFTVSAEDLRSILEASGDDSPWYTTSSPWGGPVVPPEHLMGVALRLTNFQQMTPAGARLPGMWAAHALTVAAPLALDTPYRMKERLANTGRSGRTHFLEWEFTVSDLTGKEHARGRHKVKWFSADPSQTS